MGRAKGVPNKDWDYCERPGKVYGRLTLLRRLSSYHPNGKIFTAWECICSCGKTKIVNQSNIRSGNSRSCGCLRAEQLGARSKRHGYASRGVKTREYLIWVSMMQRCYNPNNKNYHRYGGRGIKVCDEWREGFINFLYSMGEKPKGKSLDRINNDGDYSPENCRWATQKEQCMNTEKAKRANARKAGLL